MIITKNEEANLPYSLEAVKGWANRIFIVDSGSTDRTEEIAAEHGAEFIFHEWPGYAKQKNWGLDNLPFESEWLLIIDADEIITPKLQGIISDIVKQDASKVPANGYYLNRRLMFMDRPIRHCGYYPSWNLRLFKRGMARYEERAVHEHMLLEGRAGYIREPMIHWDRRGLDYYTAKHNEYSTLEAMALLEDSNAKDARLRPSLVGNSLQRRRWMKTFIYHWLPVPSLFRFIYMYFLRLGILDGLNGFRFCLFISSYEMLVKLKLVEFKRNGLHLMKQGEDPAPAQAVLPVAEVAPEPESVEVSKPADVPERVQTPEVARTPVVSSPDGATTSDSARFSVVILTLDEEINIQTCIESLVGVDDIHVLDSGSTDRTREIAEEMGVKVSCNPFESFGKQRNWAIDNMPLKHDWVLHLDADERMTPELYEEIESTISQDPPEAGYYLPSKLMFMGKWLKRAGAYPTYQMRLFHSSRMRFTDYGHGQRELTDGEIGRMKSPYIHDAFSKGLDDWLAKHNRYSSGEAAQAIREREIPINWSKIFTGDRVERRRELKHLAYRAPARALVRWWIIYLFQGGFIEGRPGRTYATLLTTYERMTGIKIRWLEHSRRQREKNAGREETPEA